MQKNAYKYPQSLSYMMRNGNIRVSLIVNGNITKL